MNKFKKWQYQLIAKEMVEVLKSKSYDAHYAEDLEEAKGIILGMIPEGSSIAMGGSETLGAMGMVDIFRNGNYKFFDRYIKSFPSLRLWKL